MGLWKDVRTEDAINVKGFEDFGTDEAFINIYGREVANLEGTN